MPISGFISPRSRPQRDRTFASFAGRLFAARLSVLRAAILVVIVANSNAAQATPLTYDFTVTIPPGSAFGPLAGVVAPGTLSFDNSLIPASGFGSVGGPGLLSDLSFSWNGITYDETTANTGGLGFGGFPFLGAAQPGELTSFVFGNDCDNPMMPGTCLVLSHTNDWRASMGVSVDPDSHVVSFDSSFVYAVPELPGQFGASNVDALGPIQIAPVPEPPTLLLLMAGFMAVFAASYGWRDRCPRGSRSIALRNGSRTSPDGLPRIASEPPERGQ